MMSLKTKLAAPMVLLAAFMLVVAYIDSRSIDRLDNDIGKLSSTFVPALDAVLQADRDLYQARLAEYSYVNAIDPDDRQSARATYDENFQQAKDRVGKYISLGRGHDKMRIDPDQLKQAFDRWHATSLEVFELTDQGYIADALVLLAEDGNRSFSQLRNIYDKAGDGVNATITQRNKETSNAVSRGFWLTTLVIVFLLLLAAGVIYWFPKQVVARIEDITNRINEIANGDGDLTQTIQVSQQDELGELTTAFNTFVKNLRLLVISLQQESQHITESADSLNHSASQANETSNHQVRIAELIVTSVNEMATATQEIAQSAQDTSSQVDEISQLTKKGEETVEASVNNMTTMSEAINHATQLSENLKVDSEGIASVIDVIRGIAEQTNLLALNAAIEAARAGEQGRGFAVVADEVRTLANRTQQSTDEINSIIEKLHSGVGRVVNAISDGQKSVEQSLQTTQATKDALTTIIGTVDRVNMTALQTAAATEQQSQVSQEVNQNLHELKTTSETTNELMSSTHTVVESLYGGAKDLSKQVGNFKT